MFDPQRLDRLRREQGLRLEDFRRVVPARCFEISPARSWLALAQAVAQALLVGTALWHWPLSRSPHLAWQLPGLLAFWVLGGLALAGLFVIGHDCGHGTFSRSERLNDLVGYLCMTPTTTGFRSWQLGHDHHHVHTQVIREDTGWAEQMLVRGAYENLPAFEKSSLLLAYGSPFGILVGYWIGILRHLFMERAYPQVRLDERDRRRLAVSNTVIAAGFLGLSAALYALGGLTLIAKVYWGPLLFAAGFGATITLLHHSNEDSVYFARQDWDAFRGQVLSTFNVRYPRWAEFMLFDINIHLPHHVSPRIPWYRLREANDAIRRAYPDFVQETRLSAKLLRKLWSKPVLKRDGDFLVPSEA